MNVLFVIDLDFFPNFGQAESKVSSSEFLDDPTLRACKCQIYQPKVFVLKM